MSDFLRVLAVLVLILGNAVFVLAEYALVASRRTRLAVPAEGGNRRARLVLRLMDDPVRFISTTQLGITVFSILLGAVGEPFVAGLFHPPLARGLSFVFAFVIVAFLTVVLSELVPKAVALQKAEPSAMLVAAPLEGLAKLATPIIWVLDVSARAVLRLFGLKPVPAGAAVHSEEEIRQIVAHAEDTGLIEQAEEEMLYKVFDFADKEAHEVMVPRPEVTALSVDMPIEECLEAVIDSPFTRYPVYRGSLDEVIGILHVRDLFSAMYEDGIANVVLDRLVRPAHVVPETKDLGALLGEFRRTNQHMAVVLDEYGSFEGIVTLEDLLEEIVGEIEDEYDLPDESVERVDETTVRVDGTFPIDDFNEQFGQELPQEDYHTVAGFVFGALGRVARRGDEVLSNGLRFEVVDVDGPRIGRLQIEFLPVEEVAEGEGQAAE
jgi:putative hemolysin